MTSKLPKIITLLFFVFPFSLFSQQLNHVLGDVLVQLHPKQNIESLLPDLQNQNNTFTNLEIKKEVVPYMNIWLLHFDYTTIDENDFLEKIKRHPAVANAQFNHLISLRSTIPNDPEFPNQWQHFNDGNNGAIADVDMDTDLAWDITTGGLTAVGDTIVVCVIDAGLDGNHEDLVDNIWVNHGEIPNNGIDDDNNGFTDDYRGWNSFTADDNIFNNDSHGTSVVGIVGAKGNNNLGVAGVNWNIKIMNVLGGSGEESNALIAYSYPLSHRKKYNQTDGAEGAFVVATNASWGVDMGNASEYPLWCAFYDTLGNHGILNSAATANDDFNVEIEGDMPTTCSSDFLIGVTNMTSSDLKHPSAGYGVVSIDLGAPGASTWSTEPNDTYGTFGGTSAASPQVAGAISLLYAAPCSNLPTLALNDPPAAALLVKNHILNGVDPNTDLDGKTFTGGRLNVFSSLKMVVDSCGNCPAPSSLTANNLTDVNANLTWINNDSTISNNLRYRELPNGNWEEFTNVMSPFLLQNLMGCTKYEVQVLSTCSMEESGYVYSYFFTTEDCCVPPSTLEIVSMDETSATVSWNSVFAANGYNLELTPINPSGQPQIYNITPTNTSTNIPDLAPCSEYQIRMQSVCDTGLSIFSNPFTFFTSGCGTCRDLDYCNILSDGADMEWIGNVTLGVLNNSTGSNGGYGDFTGLADTELEAGQTYPFSISPAYAGSNFFEFFRAWIDYNQDGDFDDTGELIFSTPDGENTTVGTDITIPNSAVNGSTRMRVIMRWAGNGATPPLPCENINFGEIEDYCVSIVGGNGLPCSATALLDTTSVTLNSILLNWEMPATLYESFEIEYREVGETIWNNTSSSNLEQNITGLEKCNAYEFRIQTICNANSASDFSNIFTFNTRCDVGIPNVPPLISEVSIFPNPFSENVFVNFILRERTELQLEILTLDGRVVFDFFEEKNVGNSSIEISDLEHLPQGIYFLKIKTENDFVVQKVIKQN